MALALAIGAAGPLSPPNVTAQSPDVSAGIRPVITSSTRDGLLVGGNLGIGLGTWSMEVGGAYGTTSGAVRYTVGLDYREGVTLSYGDWPRSRVRGREGEVGVRVSTDLIALYRWLSARPAPQLASILEQSELRGTGFVGELWPLSESSGPQVRYLHLESTLGWPLPWGLSLRTQGAFLVGQPLARLDPAETGAELATTFRTFLSRATLEAGQTRLQAEMGSLDNPVDLAELRFEPDLRSYPTEVRADRYLIGSLLQRHELGTASLLEIPLFRILGPEAGSLSVDLRMRGSVFVEGGWLLDQKFSEGALFGWGMALSWPDLQTRVTVAVNRDGTPSVELQTGVLP